MPKTKIEWCDRTVNPVKGLCPVGCSYCYARRLYQRFKWNPEIRYDPYWVNQIPRRRGYRVFVGSTMELFGPWVDARDLRAILWYCGQHPEHTFLFLTKQPQNLPREWPDNCWVGVSVTGDEAMKDAYEGLDCTQAQVKFLSLEPLLGPLSEANLELIGAGYHYRWFDWLIIGQQTPVRESTTPKLEWIQEIVQAADKAGTPVFLKDNLAVLLPEAHPFYTFPWESDPEAGASVLRQEFPIENTNEGGENDRTKDGSKCCQTDGGGAVEGYPAHVHGAGRAEPDLPQSY